MLPLVNDETRESTRSPDGRDATPAVSSAWMKPLGEFLRESRVGRYTIEELARKAHVSAGRISQIERGLANPSFETLWRLATALEVPLGALFAGRGSEQQMVVRPQERKRLEFPRDGLLYELLTPNLQGSLEIFVLEVPPGYDGARRPPIVHRGEKFSHVQEGNLVYHVGTSVLPLAAGDSITFDPSEPHFICNPTEDKAVVLVVVTPPSF